MSIETRDLEGGAPSSILSSFRGVTFCWAPDGRILYTSPESLPDSQDTSLWELWADSKSGKPKGRPRKITTLGAFGIEQLGLTSDGKKLLVVKGVSQTDAYVARLVPGSKVEGLRRLTFDERPSFPWTWTGDSKSVIFTSNRTGVVAIYKQSVDRRLAELIPAGPESVRLARMSPDGAWIVYGAYSDSRNPDKSTSIRLMRVPVNGGAPQPILETDAKNHNFDCPRVTTPPCVIEERNGDVRQAVFSSFDPLTSRRGEMFKVAVGSEAILQWTISPDGSRLALLNSDPQHRELKIVSLSGTVEQSVHVNGWPHPMSVDWAADSKALLMSFADQSGATLVRVDFSGNAQPLYTLRGSTFTFGQSAPDGRWLEICAQALSGRNAWLLENF